ncbi:ABC transporter ATP-binding protein [Aliiroseovarius subalbicans]|uniref:ABC transporter ATP-binding protein n=1 Tax=Aliiroseovarius subalbicans TaxID=2925840 RepID=UPI001F5ABFC2|nr:ABC transporter ATP-binding protein [Aliiroseovarius subalbicans]MCI2399230.1 ABC transporter ATP-binding protein [Aliiroseovarius subalbicans]
MSVLSLKDFSVTLRDRSIFEGVTLDIQPGEFVGLIGPNGAGKTTLMRAALGLIASEGDSSLAGLSAQARARAVAWMPQAREIAWPIPVENLVALGTQARGGAADTDATDVAMARMGLEPFRGRAASRLSGGEQARALIARALAQDTPLLMADEPIAGLDPAHQISTMSVFAELAQEGRAALVSLHDLGLAARHCTRLILLAEGGVMADGMPEAVLTPDNMARAFGVSVWHGQTDDGPVFQPLEVL